MTVLLRSDLVLANILYRRPDQLWLLQTYVWQEYDFVPRFPRLHTFLDFWKRELEGPLHSVTITWSAGARSIVFADHSATLH
jgi:uncharacterized protein Usg